MAVLLVVLAANKLIILVKVQCVKFGLIDGLQTCTMVLMDITMYCTCSNGLAPS